MISIDKTKKGLILYSSPRSGSHMTCDILYKQSTIPNKIQNGEIKIDDLSFIDTCQLLENLSNSLNDKFMFASVTQYRLRNFLPQLPNFLKNYQLVNLRRRDKVSQYISWCVFRLQANLGKTWRHSPNWDSILPYLPYEVCNDDLDRFIMEQQMDYVIPQNNILYYEDIVELNLESEYKKNIYNLPFERIVSNYQFVVDTLKDFKYYD